MLTVGHYFFDWFAPFWKFIIIFAGIFIGTVFGIYRDLRGL